MKITCPNNNVQERTYIIKYFFEEMLGIPASIHFSKDEVNYIIEVDDRKIIVIEDHFFNRFPESLSYLDKKNIPELVEWFHLEGKDYPIIYGEDRYVLTENKAVIGLDIFASSFFMLSRWEEYVQGREEPIKNSKSIYQLDENSLFCVRNGIYDRQIVHEYESIFRYILNKLGYVLEMRRRSGLLITHDVDSLGPRLFKRVLKVAFSIKRERGYIPALRWICLNIRIFCGSFPRLKIFNQYCCSAKKYGFTQVFLFKCCKRHEEECTYELEGFHSKHILRNLIKNDVFLGFHPSQSVYCNNTQFEEEYRRYLNVIKNKPTLGRNHRLLHNSNTWYQWSGISIPLTSNWGYQARVGFRCGVSLPFPVFDVFLRENTHVTELPFSIMDSSLYRISKKEHEMERIINPIIASTMQYGGILCINWHVRPFFRSEFRILFKAYNKILRSLSEKGFHNIIVNELIQR